MKRSTPEFASDVFTAGDPILRQFGQSSIVAPVGAATLTFLVYFLSTAIASSIEGSLSATGTSAASVSTALVELLMREGGRTGRPFLLDVPHILCAGVLVPSLVFLAMRASLAFGPAVQRIQADGAIRATASEVTDELLRVRRIASSRVILGMRVVGALVIGGLFVSLHLGDRFPEWWGSQEQGYAGLVLAAGTVWVGYALSWACVNALLGYWTLTRVLRRGAVHKPFHPDRCGGFGPLGDLILLVYLGVIVLAVCFGLVYYFGYFGLGYSAIFILAGVGFVLCAPLLLFLPIRAIVKPVRADRDVVLRQIGVRQEELLNRITDRIEQDAESPLLQADLSMLEDLEKAAELTRSANVWPFNVRTTRSLILAYGVQVAAVVFELIRSGG